MSHIDKLSGMLNRLFGTTLVPVKGAASIIPASKPDEEYEIQKMEFFVTPDLHLDAVEAELRRVRVYWSTGCRGMGILQEAKLDMYIDSLLAFKMAFKHDNVDGQHAMWCRAQSDKHMRYTLEVYDHEGTLLRSTSYTHDLF